MMPIAKDYLEPTDTQDATETQFVDRLLEHWGRWQRNDGLRLRPTNAGQLLGINPMAYRSWDLNITDDQFTKLDKAVARLPRRLAEVVFIEYVRMAGASSDEKARYCGLNRLAYRQRLNAAQWAVVTTLGAELDRWRQKGVNRAQDGSSHPEAPL